MLVVLLARLPRRHDELVRSDMDSSGVVSFPKEFHNFAAAPIMASGITAASSFTATSGFMAASVFTADSSFKADSGFKVALGTDFLGTLSRWSSW